MAARVVPDVCLALEMTKTSPKAIIKLKLYTLEYLTMVFFCRCTSCMRMKIRIGNVLRSATTRWNLFLACQRVALEPIRQEDTPKLPDLLDIISILPRDEKFPETGKFVIHPDFSRLRPGFHGVLFGMFVRYNYRHLTVLDGVVEPNDETLKLFATHCPSLEFLRVLPDTSDQPNNMNRFTNIGIGVLIGVDVTQPPNQNKEYPKDPHNLGCLKLKTLILRPVWTQHLDMFIPAVLSLPNLIEYDECCTMRNLQRLVKYHKGKTFNLEVMTYQPLAMDNEAPLIRTMLKYFPNLKSLNFERTKGARDQESTLAELQQAGHELDRLKKFSCKLTDIEAPFTVLLASGHFRNLTHVKIISRCLEGEDQHEPPRDEEEDHYEPPPKRQRQVVFHNRAAALACGEHPPREQPTVQDPRPQDDDPWGGRMFNVGAGRRRGLPHAFDWDPHAFDPEPDIRTHFFNPVLRLLGRHCPHLTHVTLRGDTIIQQQILNPIDDANGDREMFRRLQFLSLESLFKGTFVSRWRGDGRARIVRKPVWKVEGELIKKIFANATHLKSVSLIGNYNNFLDDDFVNRMTAGHWKGLDNLTILSNGPSSSCLQARRDCHLPTVLGPFDRSFEVNLGENSLWHILERCKKIRWLAMDGWRIPEHHVQQVEYAIKSRKRSMKIIRRKFREEDTPLFHSHVVSYPHPPPDHG